MESENQVSNGTSTGVTEELLHAAAALGPHCQQPAHVRVPFPLIALPRVLRGFVKEAADAMGVAPECVATPAIATCAVAIGNTHRIRLQPSRTEPSVIWAVTLMESGSSATPAYHAAIAPLVARQAEYDAQYQEEMDQYSYEKNLKQTNPARWKVYTRGENGVPIEPVVIEPVAADLITSKCSVEALGMLLVNNPQRLALTQEELSGFFSKVSGGGEEYLEFYNAGTVKLHRSNGKHKLVPAAALSIFGMCQASMFRKAIGVEGSNRNPVENPLAARFILASPSPPASPQPTAPTPPARREPYETGPYHRMIGELLAMQMSLDSDFQFTPAIVSMLPEAEACFATFIAEHDQQTAAIANPALRSHYANLVAVAGRLALIFHLCDQVTQQLGDLSGGKGGGGRKRGVSVEGVPTRHVLAGIALARWYGRQATQVYDGSGSRADWEKRDLLKEIRKHGGSITPRAMGRVRTRWANSEVAEKMLRALEREGHGKFVTEPAEGGGGRGRPSFCFKLFERLVGEGPVTEQPVVEQPVTPPVGNNAETPGTGIFVNGE